MNRYSEKACAHAGPSQSTDFVLIVPSHKCSYKSTRLLTGVVHPPVCIAPNREQGFESTIILVWDSSLKTVAFGLLAFWYSKLWTHRSKRKPPGCHWLRRQLLRLQSVKLHQGRGGLEDSLCRRKENSRSIFLIIVHCIAPWRCRAAPSRVSRSEREWP